MNCFIKEKIHTFFSRGDERTVLAKKNIVMSFVIKGISILTSLVVVPLTISYINPTQYGIWLTLSSIVAWLGFFDIGFGNGLRNRFAEAKVTNDYAKIKIYVSTTYICLACTFTLICIVFFCVNSFVNWNIILNASGSASKNLSTVALITFSSFCLRMIFQTINVIFIADQKPAKSAFFDLLGQILMLTSIFILTKTTSDSLVYLALVAGFSPILIMTASSVWFYTHDYKKYKPSIYLFDKKVVKDILNLGSKFFFLQIAVLIIYQTNNIIIIQICGPNDVTIYNIAFKYFFVIQMFFMIIVSPLWSASTDAYASKDIVWIKNIIRKLKFTWVMLIIISVFLLLISKSVYETWLGNNKVDIPFSLSAIVCIYILIRMRVDMYVCIINGIGKIKLQLYINIALCIFNIPITVLFGMKGGVIGIVMGNILISLVLAIWAPIQLKRILNNNAKGIWNK
jgi:O-antigen/teichoic acid export membrane protein